MKTIIKVLFVATIAISGWILMSCEKTFNDEHTIRYVVKGLTSDFKVAYIDELGETVKPDPIDTINWSYSFKGKRGDILYLYLRYKDEIDMMSNFYVAIEVDGKILKEAHNYDMVDTNNTFPYQIIRKGVVPF